MTWFTYEDQHHDFENDPRDLEQKLKGPVSFSLDVDDPPKIEMEVDIKRKSLAYKIKERITNVKSNTRKLF